MHGVPGKRAVTYSSRRREEGYGTEYRRERCRVAYSSPRGENVTNR